jgi:hypothetical protein
MLHSSELRCPLLSYASPYGPSIAASLILPTKYTEKIPRNFQKQNASLQAQTRLPGAYRISFHWISETLIFNITREIFHCTSEDKKLMSPAPQSCSDPTSDINDTDVEKNPRNVPVWQKIRQSIYHCLYSSTEQLQVCERFCL